MKTLNHKELTNRLVKNAALQTNKVTRILQGILKEKQIIADAFIQHGQVSSSALAEAIAAEMRLPLIDLNTVSTMTLPTDILGADVINEAVALPLSLNDQRLLVAISSPEALKTIVTPVKQQKLQLVPIVTQHDILVQQIKQLFPQANRTNEQFTAKEKTEDTQTRTQINDSALDKMDIAADDTNTADTSDFPVVRFINKIILDSINKSASDIHFEPFENSYRIRVRVDGVLNELAQPEKALAPRLAARLKVMAGLDISERRIPQDGRFKINLSKGETIGFRVNTCPTLFGEKIVLRILDPKTVQVGVDGLGFEEREQELFINAITKHQGMILVTGPTGSGKTVTLYTALNRLNSPEKNISTAEDPVEIYLPGINQVNINPKTGLDFSAVLRAFLRQDPDIIMLGEIRDHETAEIAMKAAQTGHLVLSTLHTNGAAETLTRMENMGTAAFNIATSVSLVIAQRLVRKLCEHCKSKADLGETVLLKQGFKESEVANLTIYKPNGCDQCTAGYKGRLAIFEVLELTPDIAEIIMNQGSSVDIHKQAITNGMLDLQQAGLNKVRQGITSLEEINRVIG